MRRFILTLTAMLGLLALPARTLADTRLPETCYLFANFYHDEEGAGFRLAWSPDGYRFTTLNEGKSYLKPTAGSAKIMRDPHLYRAADGVFHLVWTTGWTGRDIGYASSPDLVHWSEQKAIPVMTHEPEAQNCWAPELVWDDAKQHYLIFWSTTILGRYPETAMSNKRPERNHRIYSTTTKDFVTFSPAKLMYDGGYNVIDANLLKDGDEWLLFVKDETFAPKTQKNIRMIRGKTAEGPWGEVSAPLTGSGYWAEGPSAIKVGDEYRVYFDKHMADAIGMVISKDLQTWTDVSNKVSTPPHARHGCIVAVPREIVEKLIARKTFDAAKAP